MRRRFGLTHTVRYDECNADGFLTPVAFLRYMQDLAARDAEDAKLAGDGFWVAKRTIITWNEQISIYTPLELQTYGLGFSRITAQRGYEAHRADGSEQALIQAHTLWVYLDVRGRPIRLPAETAQIWMPGELVAPQSVPAFPAFPTGEFESTLASVRFSDIDLMRHLNNASAVEILDNAMWEVAARRSISPETTIFVPIHYDVVYEESPRFGDELEVLTWLEPLPALNGTFAVFHQIKRGAKVMVRAHSLWRYTSRKPIVAD